MTLSIEDRQRARLGLARYWSSIWEEGIGDVSKADLLLTIEETDDWIEANQWAYNDSLTHAGKFSAQQKTLIFCVVALARVSIAFLRQIVGEVD